MTNKTFLGGVFFGFALAALAGGGVSLLKASPQNNTSQAAPKCKISPVEAIKIAQKKVPGRPLQSNFEFDEGKWVYGVMIVSGSTIKEVTIDPITGKVGGTETVTPDDEAKEIKEMLQKAVEAAPSKASPKAEKEEDEKKEKE